MTPPKKPTGRPATTGRTPDATRSKRSLENLKISGGKQVRFNCRPEATAQMQSIMVAHGLSQTEAMHWALAQAAKRLPKG